MTALERSLRVKYRTQRKNAKRRKIKFNLTFEEWLNIWEESGHLHERGRGKYVMGRLLDRGPYSVWNVRIITNTQNMREAWRNKTPAERRAWKEGSRKAGRKAAPRLRTLAKERIGIALSAETRAKISVAITRARARKNWYPKPNAETRAKMSASMKRVRSTKKWGKKKDST